MRARAPLRAPAAIFAAALSVAGVVSATPAIGAARPAAGPGANVRACGNAIDCVGVGWTTDQAGDEVDTGVYWNGKSWAGTSPPGANDGGAARDNAVSCAGSFCIEVGGDRRAGLLCASGAGIAGAAWEVIGVKTVLTWAAVAFVIYYLVTAPEGAAHVLNVAVDWLKGAGSSLGTFLNNVKL